MAYDGDVARMSNNEISLSVRLDLPGGSRFGPGKAALLSAIEKEGSVSGAAKVLGMSYPRASKLVGEMNDQFAVPLVEMFQGGATRGGANITEFGRSVLSLYKEITSKSKQANTSGLAELLEKTQKQP